MRRTYKIALVVIALVYLGLVVSAGEWRYDVAAIVTIVVLVLGISSLHNLLRRR